MEDVKIKISALWFFVTLAWLMTMVFLYLAPGFIDEVRAGQMLGEAITGEALLGSAIILLVPLGMAVLSVTLSGSINRWVNIIAGIACTFLNVVSTVIAAGMDLSIFAYELVIDVLMVVATVLIVWYAWKWPKEEG